MKSPNNLIKDEKGSILVVVALMLTIFLGFSAFAIDIGKVVLEKQQLQNAIDAACLAAAQDLPDTSQAEDTANQYIQLNGYAPSDISITFSDAGQTINITANKQIEYSFARIFNKKNVTIHPSAAATSKSMGAAFNYTLFSGSTTEPLSLNGNNFYIGGSSHTNYKFTMNGSSQTITGACEAVSTIKINGSKIDVPNQFPNASFVDMPDFSEIIKTKAEISGQTYVGNQNFNGSYLNLNAPIYVDGDISINGSNFAGQGCILATGNISLSGSNLKNFSDDAVCFYSQNGDITINGSSAVLDGIVYAPNGRITMNGSNQTVHGRVIGNEVTFNGSNTTIIGGTSELMSLPATTVKLIK